MAAIVITLDDVRRALAAPRAGRAAQERMSPHPRPGDRFPMPAETRSKQAAVLLLLYEANGTLFFYLTQRTETVASHKGQISLPGGERQDGEALVETALRETYEEIGIDPSKVEILGAPLTPLYIPVSDFWVTPFVGYLCGEPKTCIASEEVHQILATPLASLLDDTLIGEEEWNLRGLVTRVPFFRLHGYKVWGATAMILAEFSAMLRAQLAQPAR